MTSLGGLKITMGTLFFIWDSLQTILEELDNTIEKFVTNLYFVKKLKFQLLSPFLIFVFLLKKCQKCQQNKPVILLVIG